MSVYTNIPTSGGSGGLDQLTGDVTAGPGTGSQAATIATGAVTLAKMADLATDRLIGRDTAGTGVPEALTVGGGVEFTGSGGIQRSALTSDVTASAGSGVTTIANVPALATRAWVTDTVSGGAVQDFPSTLSMSGTDIDYIVTGTILTSNATVVYSLQFNSVATDQVDSWIGRDSTSAYSGFDNTLMYIVDVVATSTINFTAHIVQKTGQPRQITIWTEYGDGGHTVHGRWNVTTAITAIRVHASAAGGILNDSQLRVRRA